MKTLYYGDNGIHEFWEEDKKNGDRLLIFRNHKEKQWLAHIMNPRGDDVIGDDKQNKKNPKGTWTCLSAKTSGQLAKKITIQENMKIEFNYTKIYKGKKRMKLVAAITPQKALKESKEND